MYGVSGTIWNGQSNKITINNDLSLDDTEWTFSVWKLFIGQVALQIQTHFDGYEIKTEAGVSFLSTYFVNNLSAIITAEKITKLADIPIVQLSGKIALDIDHAHWKAETLPVASGQIIWHDARITVAEATSLGKVTIDLSENDQDLLNANIQNKGGDIFVSGTAELVPEADYAVDIKLSPASTASDNIKSSLSLFAKKQKNGDFLIKNTGQLNQLGLL